MIDLHPAARRMAALLDAVPDAALGAATPCRDYTLGDLVDHIGGLTIAFTQAATKEGDGGRGPSGEAARLEPGWRQRIASDLDRLAAAWTDPAAWSGTTFAGTVELPGAVAGVVALDELVVHGWDVARATGQIYDVDAASIDACVQFVAQFSGPGDDEARGDAFGPVVPVADRAPALDRLIAMTGRDPAWDRAGVR